MAAHSGLKNEFTEDEIYHNLMTWLILFLHFSDIYWAKVNNASVFYFDNISFLAHVLNQLFLPNQSSVSQAALRTIVLRICFQLFKKQTILWR